MVVRQLPAATARSVPLSSTCMSFSASAKVEGDTSGPTAGAVPNAGGAPGGSWAGFGALLGPAAAVPSKPRDVRDRNCLSDFDMCPPNRIVAGHKSAQPPAAPDRSE